jgi:hypothetical protein
LKCKLGREEEVVVEEKKLKNVRTMMRSCALRRLRYLKLRPKVRNLSLATTILIHTGGLLTIRGNDSLANEGNEYLGQDTYVYSCIGVDCLMQSVPSHDAYSIQRIQTHEY